MEKSLINNLDFFDFDSKEGINRLAYTDMDIKYKCKIIRKMQEIGMKVCIDKVGNICGEIYNKKNKKYIIIGSHTDSVPNGGQYDGCAGVIAGLKAIERVLNNNKCNSNIKLIIYACEESSRFNIACIGSKYLSNKISDNDINEIKDKNGTRLKYVIKDAKFFIEKNKERYDLKNIEYVNKVIENDLENNTAIELHIEQYDSLYENNKEIGIVTSVVAPFRITVNIKGEQGHTGATPIEKRKDAIVAGALFVNKINKLSKDEDNNFRATVTKFHTQTWSANVIQDNVDIFLDIRLQHPNTPKTIENKIKNVIKNVEKITKTKFTYKVITADKPVKLDEETNKDIKDICEQLKLSYQIMPSWAGHDIANVPANKKVLIFIPSQELSHNPNEKITEKDLENGIDVLYKLILKEDKKV